MAQAQERLTTMYTSIAKNYLDNREIGTEDKLKQICLFNLEISLAGCIYLKISREETVKTKLEREKINWLKTNVRKKKKNQFLTIRKIKLWNNLPVLPRRKELNRLYD